MNDAPLIVLKELAGNPEPGLDAMQQLAAPHVDSLVTFWISVWICTCFILVGKLIAEYNAHRSKR